MKIDDCVVQCLKTMRGSYPLFRGFGMDAVDQVGAIRRAQIQRQISAYYPDITGVKMSRNEQGKYIVEIRGYMNET